MCHRRAVCNTAFLTGALVLVLSMGVRVGHSSDWPMWRADARRSATTKQQLADELHLQWIRRLPTPHVAWPDQPRITHDQIHEPVVAGELLYIGSSQTSTMAAYNTRDGSMRWMFPVDGPVRLAPVVADGLLYFTSDDGYLYCLDAERGTLLWKFRGGPSDRWVLGNERLISAWPARGGPVVAEGTVYFAASIWPFMGTFLHALDAETGAVRWTNDGDGSLFIQQPHNSDSFAGIAPQGSLVVIGDHLLVPGGRSLPACYDRHTGELVHYLLAENSKRGGGSEVMAAGEIYINGGQAFETATGKNLASFAGPTALDEETIFDFSPINREYRAYDLSASAFETIEVKDRRGNPVTMRRWSPEPIWSFKSFGGDDLIRAGDRLYAADGDKILAIELPRDDVPVRVVWEESVDGHVARILAADDRLFAVTLEGDLCCFGANATTARRHAAPEPPAVVPATNKLDTLLAAAGTSRSEAEGYAIVWGAGDRDLVTSMLNETELRLVVVDPDREQAEGLRLALTAMGLYDERISVHEGRPGEILLPPYLANLTFIGDPAEVGLDVTDVDDQGLATVFDSMRPFGGAAVLTLDESKHKALAKRLGESALVGAALESVDGYSVLTRSGPLPGSGNWTHEHADAANTRASTDTRVRAPLGLLWFGGTSNEDVLPRHGHGPQPQVIDGRLFIEGPDMLRAVDIYTGRFLWQRELPGVGGFFNNTSHDPGANGTGTNYISASDGIYVAFGEECLRLDPASGETMAHFTLPRDEERDAASAWGYLNVVGDLLIGGADPIVVPKGLLDFGRGASNITQSASKRLVAMDRYTGEVRWTLRAENHFRHNAICVGGGRLYAVDHLSEQELAMRKRRGEHPDGNSRLAAYDLETGRVIWGTSEGVFGTWLGYSAEQGMLIESGRPGRDMLGDEPKGMRAFRAADGSVLWSKPYPGPPILLGDRIFTENAAYDLASGEVATRIDPLTDREVPWTWQRNYGCNAPMASTNLLTFRSGAAGYYDLAGDGGTGNFGGFRSGCTNNLIVAGGILCAPDYTRTCTCGYQNQTSIALVPMADVEMWTEYPLADLGKHAVERLAVNLGAPGDRRDAAGRLWLNECDLAEVDFDPSLGYYTTHMSHVASPELPWVAASGCRGIRRVVIDMGHEANLAKETGGTDGAVDAETGRFTVRLHFCDPDNVKPGRRVFDVSINGSVVLEDFDIVAAGGSSCGIVREFHGLPTGGKLEIDFDAVRNVATSDVTRRAEAAILNAIEIERER